MTVVFLGNYPNDAFLSMDRFAEMLNTEFEKRGIETVTLTPPVIFGRLRRSGQGLGKWLGYLDKYVVFPPLLLRFLRKLRRDGREFVVHICDHSNSIYTWFLQHTDHVVTCHDLLAIRSTKGEFSQNPTSWTGRLYQNLILSGLKRAQVIASVSHQTREDLLRLTHRSGAADCVILNGLNYPYSPMPAQQRDAVLHRLDPRLTATPYVLHVGGNQWYKNRPFLARVFARVRSQTAARTMLVFAGNKLETDLMTWLETQGLGDRCIALGHRTEEELRALYSGAAALFFPSLAEGFGWPIIEAQACGCPVVTSDREPMRSVGGAAAVTVNPEDIEGAAAGLLSLLQEGLTPREQRVAEGLRNAASYSAGRMADEYVGVYASLLGKSAS